MGKKEYMLANKDWLAEKAKEEGVMPLPKGYRLLRKSSTRIISI